MAPMEGEIECEGHETKLIPRENKLVEPFKPGQAHTVKDETGKDSFLVNEDIGEDSLFVKEETDEDLFSVKEDSDNDSISVIEDADEDSLIVKEEPNKDPLTAKEKTDKDIIDFATNWRHVLAPFFRNNPSRYVDSSFDVEKLNGTRVSIKATKNKTDFQITERRSGRKQIRGIFLHEFKMGRTAAATSRKISRFLGPRIADKRTIQYWFKKFRNGDESLEDDEHSGRLKEVENDQLPTKCMKCDKQFKTTSRLWEHISTVHLKEAYRICGECGQKFSSWSGLKRHVDIIHDNILYLCPCKDCDHPGYKCKQALAAHIRSVHRNTKSHVCETCGMAFFKFKELRMHRLTHTCKRVYQCLCGSTFRYKAGLENHQRLCILD